MKQVDVKQTQRVLIISVHQHSIWGYLFVSADVLPTTLVHKMPAVMIKSHASFQCAHS